MHNTHRNNACTWLLQDRQKAAYNETCKGKLHHQGLHPNRPHHLLQKLDSSFLLSLVPPTPATPIQTCNLLARERDPAKEMRTQTNQKQLY
jgi:hypothetical protein